MVVVVVEAAVAALAAECHAAALAAECHAAASLVAEWARLELDGAVLMGIVPAIGTVLAIGTAAAIGTVAITGAATTGIMVIIAAMM